MVGDEGFNRHRRIISMSIIALHVAFVLRGAHAQPMSPLAPSSYEMQTKPDPSKAIIFAVLLSAFFFIGFLSVYLRNCSGSDSISSARHLRRAADWSRRGGLDDAVVESFPVFAYSSVKDWKIGSGALECAVCLSEFEENEMLRLIPRCNHVFHVDCIDAWLYSHSTCPVCRAKLAPEPEKLGEDDPPITEPIAEPSGPENTAETNRGRDHIAIDIDGNRTGDSEAIDPAMRRDKRSRRGIAGKFPRSNSTGHSLAQLRESTERYTLRLPEDVRKRIMAASGRRLKRTRSYDGVWAAAEEGSGRRGCRSGGEGSSSRGRGYRVGSGERLDRVVSWADRWNLFVSKMGAVRSPNDNGEAIVRVRDDDGPLKMTPLTFAVSRQTERPVLEGLRC